jgi:hypothetical protein
MKKIIRAIFVIAAMATFFSCQKKEENKEIYVNPAFKENLSEVFDVISKRYIIDYNDLEKKFGPPTGRIIDSLQSGENEAVFDSTFIITFNKTTFHYYKKTSDKKFIFTGVDLKGDFKAKQFTLTSGSSREYITELFGEPLKTNEKINSIEMSYPIYKDEEGKSYDTIIFIFVEDKFVGINYVPYIETAEDTGSGEQY